MGEFNQRPPKQHPVTHPHCFLPCPKSIPQSPSICWWNWWTMASHQSQDGHYIKKAHQILHSHYSIFIT